MVGTEKNLLSIEIANRMGIVIKVNQVQKIFDQGSYMKSEPTKILLKEDAKSYCVMTARRISFSFILKVKTELEHLEGEKKSPN